MNVNAAIEACDRLQRLTAEFDRVCGDLIGHLSRGRLNNEPIPGATDLEELNLPAAYSAALGAVPNPVSQEDGS